MTSYHDKKENKKKSHLLKIFWFKFFSFLCLLILLLHEHTYIANTLEMRKNRLISYYVRSNFFHSSPFISSSSSSYFFFLQTHKHVNPSNNKRFFFIFLHLSVFFFIRSVYIFFIIEKIIKYWRYFYINPKTGLKMARIYVMCIHSYIISFFLHCKSIDANVNLPLLLIFHLHHNHDNNICMWICCEGFLVFQNTVANIK